MKAHEYAKFFTANSEMGKKFLALAEQEPESEIILWVCKNDYYESISEKLLILGMKDFKAEDFVKITETFGRGLKREEYMRLEEYKLRSSSYDPTKFSVRQIKAIVVGMV